VQTDWEPHSDHGSAPWGDTVGVFQQQATMSWLTRVRRIVMQHVRYWTVPGYRA